MSDEVKKSVVLYPSPGMGHLVSMVELGKIFARHGLAVTILIVEPPYKLSAIAEFIESESAANPSLSFHRLPPVERPPNPSTNHEAIAFDILRHSNPHLLAFLRSTSPRALVIDFFCTYALEVTSELGMACYVFFTSGANVLAMFLNFPVLHKAYSQSFRELGYHLLDIPGIPPLPANHMPLPMLDRDDLAYIGFLGHSTRFVHAQAIIINTFDALEPRVLEAITAGHCVPQGCPTPAVRCIGPLIKSTGIEARNRETMEMCIRWLDGQPPASVVYLCFGSIGLFPEEQLRKIADGLERSGQRFLWVVRSPPGRDPLLGLDELLPDGFLGREKGLVVKSWAPQVEVLNHKAVGGFVTHCGWNSVLEAIMAGVPMVAWPLYAEQWVNKVFLVEEMRLAVAMEGYDRELVTAEEVEAKVRWLMESEGGQELRARAAAMKERAAESLAEGGSSHAALMTLVKELKQSAEQ